MTPQEAKEIIKVLNEIRSKNLPCETPITEALNMAVEALEKQIPRKPINRKGTTYFHCPVCEGNMLNDYCADCGQAILWESE